MSVPDWSTENASTKEEDQVSSQASASKNGPST